MTQAVIFHSKIYGHPFVKKNCQKIIYHKYLKRNIAVYTTNYTGWANDAMMQLGRTNRSGRLVKKIDSPIDKPIILKCHFYVQDNRRCDISALYEGIQDILVKCQILKDDNWKIVQGHDGSRVFVDKENPRIELWILEEVATT